MIKPLRGAGGWRNKVVRSREDLDRWIAQFEGMPFLLQEVVDGFPASVCCIADGNRAVGIAANEQILRGDDVAPYGFCGSLTPLEHQVKEKMIACAEQIAAASGCTGCIGIDFVISGNTPYAIEINPRFQGTLDTVELSTGCNLFDLHVQACRGIIPRERPEATQAAARSILFADRDITVREDLSRFSGFATDIPWPGTFFEGGQAVMSVTGTGRDPTSARSALDTNISTIRQYIR
jgi:predicted ATP-grasp superfamily ATP-dependent carboligase